MLSTKSIAKSENRNLKVAHVAHHMGQLRKFYFKKNTKGAKIKPKIKEYKSYNRITSYADIC